MIKKIFISFLFLSTTAFADITVNNMSKQDVEDVINDTGAVFAFSSGASAAPLGKIFGFEVGFQGGMANTPKLDTVAKKASASNSISSLPYANVLGRLSFPLGIMAEVSVLPSIGGGGAKLSSTGFALGWTSTGWLIDIGLKGHMANSKFTFDQTSPVASTIEIENKISGVQLFVSRNLIFAEPYLGIGTVTADGTMTATTSVFASSAQKETATISGSHMVVGSEFKLGFFKLGLEYASLLGTSRYGAKFAFYF